MKETMKVSMMETMKDFDLAGLMEQLTVRDSEHHLVKTLGRDEGIDDGCGTDRSINISR